MMWWFIGAAVVWLALSVLALSALHGAKLADEAMERAFERREEDASGEASAKARLHSRDRGPRKNAPSSASEHAA